MQSRGRGAAEVLRDLCQLRKTSDWLQYLGLPQLPPCRRKTSTPSRGLTFQVIMINSTRASVLWSAPG